MKGGLLPCGTCGHTHMRPTGEFVKCPVCVFDPSTDMRLQGCWITERSG